MSPATTPAAASRRPDRGDAPEFVLGDFLPYQLAALSNRVSEGFSPTYRERFGMSLAEWRVMAHLSQAEKVSIREIYSQVEMDKSKTSRAAARLVKAGLVVKRTNASDRRLIELSLSDRGRQVMAELVPMALDYEKDLLGLLPEDEARVFTRVVRRLLEHFS